MGSSIVPEKQLKMYHFDQLKNTSHPNRVILTCLDCDSSFVKKPTLMIHKRIHKGEKAFQYQDCDSSFRHRKFDTGAELYQSQQCGFNFSDPSAWLGSNITWDQ